MSHPENWTDAERAEYARVMAATVPTRLPNGWKGFLLAFMDAFDGEPEDEAAFREIVDRLELVVQERDRALDQ